jgi:flavin-dependent dehydrogenase
MLLARAGARVLLIDKGKYGTDTLSTHALMRGAVLQLTRWGVLPAVVAAGTPAVRKTTFSYSQQDVSVPIEPRFGVDALYAPRRLALDRILVDAAIESGVEVRYGVRADGLTRDGNGRVCGVTAASKDTRHTIAADIVIGADGLHSTIAAGVGAPDLVRGRFAAGVLYSYWEDVPVDEYYWRFVSNASIGAIPTNGGTCVFASTPSARFREVVRGDAAAAYRRLLREISPAFASRLDEGRQLEPVRGFAGQVGFIKRGAGPGWALVGDAGYFKDPITAHGITDALRDAELLARAIIKGTAAAFADYEAMRLDLSRRLFEVTDAIASYGWTDDEVQLLHRAFSGEMSREVRTLAALGPAAFDAPVTRQPNVA